MIPPTGTVNKVQPSMQTVFNRPSPLLVDARQNSNSTGDVMFTFIIGVSMSEPHTSLFNCDFSYTSIYYLSYVVPYVLEHSNIMRHR